MTRYTAAYSSLIERFDEVEILRQSAAEKERQNPVLLRKEVNALCRGSVVLLSSHLEAFIRSLGEIALDSLYDKAVPRSDISSRLYYHISKDILDEVRDTLDPDKIGDKVFSFIASDAPYWSRSGSFPQPIPADRFNRGFSNPAYDRIKKYFNRFGYGNYARDLATHLQPTYDPTVNAVNHLVDIRNRIAHGDVAATKTPLEVGQMAGTIRLFSRITDSIFARWWKDNYCSIR